MKSSALLVGVACLSAGAWATEEFDPEWMEALELGASSESAAFEQESDADFELSAEQELTEVLETTGTATDCVQHTYSTDPGDCDNRNFVWGTRTYRSCEAFGKSDNGLQAILNYYRGNNQDAQVQYRCNGESTYFWSTTYDTCTATVCVSSPAPVQNQIMGEASGQLSPPSKVNSKLKRNVIKKRKRCPLRVRSACRQNRVRYYPRARGSSLAARCCLFGVR